VLSAYSLTSKPNSNTTPELSLTSANRKISVSGLKALSKPKPASLSSLAVEVNPRVACVIAKARPDYIVIDDLDDDELCRNEKRVKELTDWVKEALFGALDVGRGRFIMVGNLISKNSVLANLAASPAVFVSEIKAVDANGNPVWKEKWSKEEADNVRRFMGYRAWEKEMMHNPINDGTIFRHEWIRFKKNLFLSTSTICSYATLTHLSNLLQLTTIKPAACGVKQAASST